jgi:hypothetical protein
MDSMSWGELTFLVIMALGGLLLKPLVGSGLGTMGLIRSAIGNISSAREEYDAQKGSHAWSLTVKGRDNRRFTDIAGIYPVIGPYRETGFILETQQGTHFATAPFALKGRAKDLRLRSGLRRA